MMPDNQSSSSFFADMGRLIGWNLPVRIQIVVLIGNQKRQILVNFEGPI